MVEAEIGDSWIHGVGTDPWKVAGYRALCRLRESALASGDFVEGDPRDTNVAENLLLVAEHTWGLDEKSHLGDHEAYVPRAFRHAKKGAAFRLMERSWAEQRGYLENAVASFSGSMKQKARASLHPQRQAARATFSKRRPDKPILLGDWAMGLCPSTGCLNFLEHRPTGRRLAGGRHYLGALSYQTFSKADYERFFRQYNTWAVDWAVQDFTKPGMESGHSPSRRTRTVLRGWRKEKDVLEIALGWPERLDGAPRLLRLRVSPLPDSEGLLLELLLAKKLPHRLPEAIWFSFFPGGAQIGKMELDKMGTWIDPQAVVIGGGRHLHAVHRGVRHGEFCLETLDVPLVAPGAPSLLDFNQRAIRPANGAHFNLYNNVWGTNFPMWYQDDIQARFRLGWNLFS